MKSQLLNNGAKTLIISILRRDKKFPFISCNATWLVLFHQCIDEKGIELILSESIRVDNGNDDNHHHETVFIDSAVQEKNVTFPTESKLNRKIVGKVLKYRDGITFTTSSELYFYFKRNL